MLTFARAIAAAAALTVLAGCGEGTDEGDGPNALNIAERIQSRVDSVTEVVKITEDNDPNGDIGRPGKYTQAVSIADQRAECSEPLDISCGAKLEVWPTEEGAENRSEFIQAALEGAQVLGSEYHYLDGLMLLRVSGELKPSEAEEYEAAFAD